MVFVVQRDSFHLHFPDLFLRNVRAMYLFLCKNTYFVKKLVHTFVSTNARSSSLANQLNTHCIQLLAATKVLEYKNIIIIITIITKLIIIIIIIIITKLIIIVIIKIVIIIIIIIVML